MHVRFSGLIVVLTCAIAAVAARADSVTLLSQSRVISAFAQVHRTDTADPPATDQHQVRTDLPGLLDRAVTASVDHTRGAAAAGATQESTFQTTGQGFAIAGKLDSSATWDAGPGYNDFIAKSYSAWTITFSLDQDARVDVSGVASIAGSGQSFVNIIGLKDLGWKWFATESLPSPFHVAGILPAGTHTLDAFAEGGTDPSPRVGAYRNDLNFVLTGQWVTTTHTAPLPPAAPGALGLLLAASLLLARQRRRHHAQHSHLRPG